MSSPYLDKDIGRVLANVAASTTAGVLVNAIVGKRIAVLQLVAVAGGTATDVTFNSASTAISPLFSNGTHGPGIALPYTDYPWFITNANEALTVTTGSGSTTGILVIYALLPDITGLSDEQGNTLIDEQGNIILPEG